MLCLVELRKELISMLWERDTEFIRQAHPLEELIVVY